MQFEKNTDSQARKRLAALFDDGIYTEINSIVKEKDSKAGVVSAYGYVNSVAVYAFSQEIDVNGGAVGAAQAKKIAKLYELAATTGIPVVGIHDSNGAFVDGSADSLAAYGMMLNAASAVSGVVPQISVIAGTCAGSAAMVACSSDFVIMSKDAELFVTPPCNAEKTGAGTAQRAAEAGIAAEVCDDDMAAIEKARTLISLLPCNNLSYIPCFEYSESSAVPGDSLESIIAAITDADSAEELYSECGKAAYTGFATISGSTVGIAATNKTSDKLTGADCAKLSRFVRTCDAFSVPVITIVDTEGFESDGEGKTTESIKAMAALANSYAEATTVKIALVSGKAVGPAFIALAGNNVNSDFTYAWENAVIAPLAPETAVEFLWHDKLKGADDLAAKRKELADEYARTAASAEAAAEKGYIDEIIDKTQTRNVITSALDVMSGKRVQKLPKKHNNIPF